MKKRILTGRRSLLLAILVIGLVSFSRTAGALPEMFTDRPGSDLPGMPIAIPHEREGFVAVPECETACRNNPECRAYVFVKPGVQGPEGYCWLKSDVPAPVKNECCTSGVVRPKTDEDRCRLYAALAVQQNQSNIARGCDYTGPRWNPAPETHYDWCRNVPPSSADFEAAERDKLLKACNASTSASGDLSASDWCYEFGDNGGSISFYPIVRNVGPAHWKSGQEGYYKIGTMLNSVVTEEKRTLYSYPHWSLRRNETAKLDGARLVFHPNNAYNIANLWVLSHPEDTNPGNNAHPGLKKSYKGSAFETDPEIVLNLCAFSEGKVVMKPAFDLKPVFGKRKVLTILWDPKRPTDPAPSRSAVENALFGPRPSVRDYFLENSGDRFTIENAGVLGWYAADKPAVHYWGTPQRPLDQEDLFEDRNGNGRLDPGEDLNRNGRLDGPDGILQPDEDRNGNGRLDYDLNGDGWIDGHAEKWAEAIRKADRDFDFRPFDANNDGVLAPDELTILIVIPQNRPFGTQRGVVGRQVPRQDLVVDNVKIKSIVELYAGSTPDIGIAAHELAHILLEAGDMYFNFFQPFAANIFSLMDNTRAIPTHLDPFHKMKLAWVAPRLVTKSGQYDIRDVETGHEVHVLYDASRGAKEYFIVENRWGGASYDNTLPFSGLAVWHIIEDPEVFGALPAPAGVDQAVWSAREWQGWGRKGIRMIRPIFGPPYRFELWNGPGPQTGYDLLSEDANANHATLRWADGKPSGFSIRSIPPAGSTMRVTIDVKGN